MLEFEGEEYNLDYIDHTKGLVVSMNNGSFVANVILDKKDEDLLFEWLSARR